jgi:hypothetical protein
MLLIGKHCSQNIVKNGHAQFAVNDDKIVLSPPDNGNETKQTGCAENVPSTTQMLERLGNVTCASNGTWKTIFR